MEAKHAICPNVLKNKFNFTSAVIRSKRSSCLLCLTKMLSQEDIMTIQKLFAALHMYVASFASQLFSSMIGSFLLDSPKGTDDCLYFNFVHQVIVR